MQKSFKDIKKELKDLVEQLKALALKEGTLITKDEIDKFKSQYLLKYDISLEEFNRLVKANKKKKDNNFSINLDVPDERINSIKQELKDTQITKEQIIEIVKNNLPPILSEQDVKNLIPQIDLPEPQEHPQTIKDINELFDRLDKLDGKLRKTKKRTPRKKVRELSGRIKEVEDNFVSRTDLNELSEQRNQETAKLREGLKKLRTEAAAPAMAALEDLKGKLKASPYNFSSQFNGSTKTFTVPSDIGTILWVYLNGGFLAEGNEISSWSGRTFTLTFAPESGEEGFIKYISA